MCLWFENTDVECHSCLIWVCVHDADNCVCGCSPGACTLFVLLIENMIEYKSYSQGVVPVMHFVASNQLLKSHSSLVVLLKVDRAPFTAAAYLCGRTFDQGPMLAGINALLHLQPDCCCVVIHGLVVIRDANMHLLKLDTLHTFALSLR